MNRTIYFDDKKIFDLKELGTLLSHHGEAAKKIVRYFLINLKPEWEIYIKPYLNGLEPDIVLLRKDTGIIIVRFDKDNPTGLKADEHLNLIEYQIRSVFCPSCYDLDVKMNWPPVTGEYEKQLFLPVITSCIVSTKLDSVQMENKFQDIMKNKSSNAREYFRLISKEKLEKNNIGIDIPFLKYDGKSKKMNGDIYNELRHWLLPYQSMFEEGNFFSLVSMQPLVLDKAQEKLTLERTSSGFRKIKGPAGSGKTNILAFRALNCSLEKKSVLFLAQNRSLVPYLMNCIFRAIKTKREVFLKIKERGRIRYDHFYSFAYKISKFLEWGNEFGELRNVQNFLEINEEITREQVGKAMLEDIKKKKAENPLPLEALMFDVILVDEFQDWLKYEWLIAKEFLKDKGEMIAAGDATQDILGTGAKVNFDELNALKGYGLPSRWRELETSYRLPYDYVPLMEGFIKEFLPKKGSMIPENFQRDAFTETYVNWIMVQDKKESFDRTIQEIKNFKSKNNIASLLYLADSNVNGYILINELVRQGIIEEKEITHTFPYPGPIKNTNHDFSKMNKSFWKNFALDSVRVRNRSGFFVQRNAMKASTINNFKGLEAKNIIYQINNKPEDMDYEDYFTRIYTGLSRLASVADLNYSEGHNFSGITVICSEPMFDEYSKTWKNKYEFSTEKLPDF
jgi:hypothetical protein